MCLDYGTYKTIEIFVKRGLIPSCGDRFFLKRDDNGFLVVTLIYVEDILVAKNDNELVQTVVCDPQTRSTMRKCNELENFLAISISETDHRSAIHEPGMIERLLLLYNIINRSAFHILLLKETHFHTSREQINISPK